MGLYTVQNMISYTPTEKGSTCCDSPSSRGDSIERISKVLDVMYEGRSVEKELDRTIQYKDDIILHCVRLANEQLGIEVGDVDLQGELDASDFDYVISDVVTGGLTNILYKVTNTRNGLHVAVRIFGNKTEQFIDRTRERIIQRHLCVQGFAKRVFARFNGGQIEEWLDGDVLSDEDFRSMKFSHLIAQEVYRLHNSSGQRELYLQLHPELQEQGDVAFSSMLWPILWKFYNMCIENVEQLQVIVGTRFDLKELRHYLERIQVICDSVKSPVVLCHGDLSMGNIVVNSSNKVLLLDYEYACFMERGFDIANHFAEFAEYYRNYIAIPSKSKQHEFIRAYLGSTATDDAVEALYKEVQPFLIAPNIFWGLWGLLQCVYSSIDGDFARYSIHRIQLFLKDVSALLEAGNE